MSKIMDEYEGTTTIGIRCKDALILGTDTRATMGHFIASKEAKKVYQIDDLTAMTIAGSVGDAQKIVRLLSIEASLYKYRRGQKMTIKALSSILSQILNNSRSNPYGVALIIGGFDKNGMQLYSFDGVGGMIEEKSFISTGSGSPIAYGVLEDHYKENMSLKDGINLATKALQTAMKRDSGSGNSIDIVIIKKDEFIKY